MGETKLNVEVASQVIANVMKRRGCSARDIIQEEVKEELRRIGITTSPNTAGPIIRTALDDAILAQTLNMENILPALKAAFSRDRKRNLDDATADLRDQMMKETLRHEKTLEDLTKANQDVRNLSTNLSEAQSRVSVLEIEFAAERTKTSTHETTIETLRADEQQLRKELAAAREEIGKMKSQLDAAQARANEFKAKSDALEVQVKTAEIDLVSARGAQTIAEEQAKLRQEVITELKAANTALTNQLRELNDRYQKTQDDLRQTAAGQADATARLDERSKQSSFEQVNQNTSAKSTGKSGSKRQIKPDATDAKTGT